MKNISPIQYLVLLLVFAISCRSVPERKISDLSKFDKNSYAKRFVIENFGEYKKLTLLNPWQGANDEIHEYILVPSNSPLPQGTDTNQVIRIPVGKIICMSTTWLSMLKSLESVSSVKGISGANLIYDEEIQNEINSGRIRDVGFEDNINKELLIRISPDLILTYGIGGESAGYVNKIRELGFKVMFLGDYLEEEPLARAEWIKVLGLLTGKEFKADSIFKYIENRYREISDSVSRFSTGKPGVMLGLPWKDTWYVSPGNSFVSRLIADAGGNYIWNYTKSDESMPYGLENVFIKAMNTDYWLNAGSAMSLNDIAKVDPRLSQLSPYKEGNVYNNNKRVSQSGANDYWESGAINQHIILKDIASILHPGLFGAYTPYYYNKLK